jgi:hypothetical protein
MKRHRTVTIDHNSLATVGLGLSRRRQFHVDGGTPRIRVNHILMRMQDVFAMSGGIILADRSCQ